MSKQNQKQALWQVGYSFYYDDEAAEEQIENNCYLEGFFKTADAAKAAAVKKFNVSGWHVIGRSDNGQPRYRADSCKFGINDVIVEVDED